MTLPLAVLALTTSASPQGPSPITLADLQRFMLQVETTIKSAEQWSEAAGKHVQVSYVPAQGFDPNRTISVLDASIESDCQALKLDLPQDKIPVYLFPNADELGRALQIGHPVVGGLSMGRWSAIALPGELEDQTFSSVAAQQLAYPLVHTQIGLYGWPVFNEGIALYLKGAEERAPWFEKPRPLEAERIVDLVKTAHTQTDYAEGAAFISYLVRRDQGDPKRLKSVLKSMSEARLIDLRSPGKRDGLALVDQAFQTVYGETIAKLEHEWRAQSSISRGLSERPVE